MMMVLISGGGSKCPPDFIFFYDLAMMARTKTGKNHAKKDRRITRFLTFPPKKLCSKSD